MENIEKWDKMLVYEDKKIDDIIRNIGKSIQRNRLEKRWSTLEFCDKANLSVSNLYKIEDGQLNINLRTFLKAVIALETTPDHLIGVSSITKNIERFQNLTVGIDDNNMDFLLDMIENWIKVNVE